MSLRDNKGHVSQGYLNTPHSNELTCPFMCIIAPMGQLQHLSDYAHCHTLHTCPCPDSCTHGHLFHLDTQHGSSMHLSLVTHPLCTYQGACTLPNTVCPSLLCISECHAMSSHITERSPESHRTDHGNLSHIKAHLYYEFSLSTLYGAPNSNT